MGRGAAQEQGQVSIKANGKALPGVGGGSSAAPKIPATARVTNGGAGPVSSNRVRVMRPVQPLTELERVQRKWQMASVAHFLEVFKDLLPLKEISEDTYEDLTPSLLESAVAEPEVDTRACLVLRDVIMSLLVAIGAATKKNLQTSWFQSLRVLVGSRRSEFMDCYDGQENVLARFENGMDFLTMVGWNVRLGMLLSLCDVAAETGQTVREAIREAEHTATLQKNELDLKGYRLMPLGRCSKKRVHYKVGKTRIYSGYKRKGTGALLVECSDSESMNKLADALDGSGTLRDDTLASMIRDVHLAPLLELEERSRRKMERKRLAEIQREESRRRNAVRPRRSKASYF